MSDNTPTNEPREPVGEDGHGAPQPAAPRFAPPEQPPVSEQPAAPQYAAPEQPASEPQYSEPRNPEPQSPQQPAPEQSSSAQPGYYSANSYAANSYSANTVPEAYRANPSGGTLFPILSISACALGMIVTVVLFFLIGVEVQKAVPSALPTICIAGGFVLGALAVAGIVLGIVALVKKHRLKGLSITAIVLGSIGIIVGAMFLLSGFGWGLMLESGEFQEFLDAA